MAKSGDGLRWKAEWTEKKVGIQVRYFRAPNKEWARQYVERVYLAGREKVVFSVSQASEEE